MKHSIPFALFLIATTASTGVDQCQAFVIPNAAAYNTCQSSSLQILWSTSEGNDASKTQPKKQVLCPDCDLCDGSGRYVNIKTIRPITRYEFKLMLISSQPLILSVNTLTTTIGLF